MMAEYKYRQATVNDVLGIYYVMKNVGYVDFVYGELSPENVIEDIEGKFALPEREVLVCYVECEGGENCHNGERILGYAIIGSYKLYGDQPYYPQDIEKEGYAYSLGIGIDPEYQGKGIGKTLKMYTIEEAKIKYRGMYTSVSSKNARSLKLQEATGFRKIKEFPDPKRKDKANTVLFVMDF